MSTTYAQNYEASLEDSFQYNLASAMASYAIDVQNENPDTLIVPNGYNKGLYEVDLKQNLHEERVRLSHSTLADAIGYASLYSTSAADDMDVYTVSGIIYMASDDNVAENTDYLDSVSGLWSSWSIQIKENVDIPGWDYIDILQSQYHRPKDLLIYYGYLNSFNFGDNAWTNEKVAQDMSKYNLIVLGDGIQSSGHADYSNTAVIIPRIKELSPNSQIFGYVSVNQTLSGFQGKVDEWDTLEVNGILLDEAGYDYGKTRSEFNDRVDYVHGKTYSNIVFANAWNTDNILGTVNDASYDNDTYNSGLVESKLTSDDWILLESFPINTASYTASTPDGYEPKADWKTRGDKAVGLREEYGVNFAACGIINNANASGSDLFNFGFTSALMYSLDAFGTSDTSYAASSATVTYWTRPDSTSLGRLYEIEPTVQQDVGDSDVYLRYAQHGKMKLDFSDSSGQISEITKW